MVPVYREIVADMETPVSAFLKINRGGDSFLLESVEGGQRLARYSFIGTEPYRDFGQTTDKTDPLDIIAEELHKYKVVPLAGLPRFAGGAVGYLSYETVNRFEKLPSPAKDSLKLPEARFMFVDTMLVFDHVTHKIKVLSYVKLNGDLDKGYQKAVVKIDDLVSRLQQPYAAEKIAGTKPSGTAKLTSNTPRKDFEANVRKIKEYITAGEAIQSFIPSVYPNPLTCRRLKSTAPCVPSILRLTCFTWITVTSRLSGHLRKCWSGSRTAMS